MNPAADPHHLQPDHLPTPFTGEEIRDATPRGTTIRLLIEEAGEPPYQRITRYVACDDVSATRESFIVSASGTSTEPPVRSQSTWRDLQEHASFPSAITRRESDVLDSPLGQLACLRYTVDDGESVTTFWFAHAYPGMPVKVVRARDGEVLETMTMIAKSLERPDTSDR